MTEVDRIYELLNPPANAWFNNPELLAFYRLIAIARRGEALERQISEIARDEIGHVAEIDVSGHPI